MGKLSQKVIVMAVAAVPLTFGASAFGQYMTGNDGRAWTHPTRSAAVDTIRVFRARHQ